MAEQFGPIEIPVIIDDSTIKSGMARVGKTIDKSSALGIAGMRGLEVVAADAGRAFGVTGEAASVLGRSVGAVTRTFGAASVAFGAAGIAAYGAYLAYDHFAVSAKKVRDETLKAAETAGLWIEKAAGEERATDRLSASKRRLYKIEFDYNKIIAERGIKEQEKVVKDALDKLRDAEETIYTVGKKKLDNASDPLTQLFYGTKESRLKAFQDAKHDYDKSAELLAQMRAKAGLFTDDVRANPADPKKKKAFEYNAEVEYLQALDQLWMTQNKNYQGHLDMQLALFDAQSSAKLNKMSAEGATIKQIRDASAVADIERMQLVAAEEDRLRAEKLAKEKQAAAEKKALDDLYWSYGVQITQGLTALAIQHGKKGAEEQKKAARMQAFVNTAAAVTKALPNWYLAALVAAAGAVQISAINSASYGSSGGGTLSLGGSSVSGNQDNYRYFNYEQSTYGSGWRPGMGQGSNTVNIYAMDSKSFEQYVNDNPDAVLNVVDKKEKGYL